MSNVIGFARSISLKECAALVQHVGDKVTVMIEGHTGSGKSSILKMLSAALPEYNTVYLDMACLDLGDIMLPAVQHDSKETSFYPNSIFGLSDPRPSIILFDELGKASRPVQNACLPILLERRVGVHKLRPGSIVFATTNLGSEGVGDTLQMHARNRMAVVTSRKPTADEWIEDFAVSAGIMPEVIAWVRETPQVMQGFEDVPDPSENEYIWHNKAQRSAFVTPRSLEKASDILKQRAHFDEDTTIHALRGTVGDRAALDLRSFVALADKLPAWRSVIADPGNCPVPANPAAVCMLVFTALGRIDKASVTPWVQYMQRMPREAQALFAFHAMKSKEKAPVVAENKAFTAYAIASQWLY